MKTALIIGCSRGLGLGLARELTARTWSVTGTVRTLDHRAPLDDAHINVAQADITDPASLQALRQATPTGLDLLFINAGISEPADFATIDAAAIGHLFLTNAVAPVRAAELLMDRLAPQGMIAFMSSRMGSIALTDQDNKAMYRASKAALNALTRTFMARLDRPRPVLTLHPGWVATDMGGPAADLDIPTSVKGLATVLESRQGQPGSIFLDYRGTELPW